MVYKIMRTTQRKGDLAVAKAIAKFTEMELDVSIPLTESAAYDIIVDDGLGLHRVQVKYCGSKSGHVDLRNIHSNSTGYVVKKCKDQAYDWLFVYDPSRGTFLIKEFVVKTGIKPQNQHMI